MDQRAHKTNKKVYSACGSLSTTRAAPVTFDITHKRAGCIFGDGRSNEK